ncbi:MAG: 30S ribosomal protein S3 [Candidatus Colwellbacteria bacterium]|jgi:small subunit ribosomal protein S3|nr:30S ribosomal protein S3 [Candidatus Colwellbacteria bacterium]MCK9497447.1 30S ribosomal protein S3 [Candidatus Colwellbacteria bacterium]MDD3752525.1 30S ribosomal protein S3 [Candidatus Colwellbacteria bacterium]MDD4818777.1 30S ribosomal protein S3 [Candidatus Colwellbacteria bacterium]
MGHKIKPNSLRLGILKGWKSRWIGDREKTKRFLEEDLIIRNIISSKLSQAGIVDIVIERTANAYRIFIKSSRPGLVIGRGGKGIEELNKAIIKAISKTRRKNKISEPIPNISLNVTELARGDVSAQVTAQNIASDLERRFKFRRTVKKYLDETMATRGVKGAKIKVGGRLDGAEIARSEWFTAGSLPLTTLRADIDYGETTAFTTYGTIGIKVWIYKGEVFNNNDKRTREISK